MDDGLIWAIGLIITILGIYAGRGWERYDRKLKKDQNLIDRILNILPVDGETLYFLRYHDFSAWFERKQLEPLRDLAVFLDQPANHFLKDDLEKKKIELRQTIDDFRTLVAQKTERHEVIKELQGLGSPENTIEKIRIRNGLTPEEADKRLEFAWNIFVQTANELNEKSSEICDKYDILIISARKSL